MKKKKKAPAPAKKRFALLISCVVLGVIGLSAALYIFKGDTGDSQGKDVAIVSASIPEKPQPNNPDQWSESELRELDNITLSYEAVQKAEEILEAKTLETFTSEDLKGVVGAFESALSLAKSVPDAVLEKVHPDMRNQFRKVYQPGLLQMLNGFKVGDQNAARTGADLYHTYGAWVSTHTHEFSYPDR